MSRNKTINIKQTWMTKFIHYPQSNLSDILLFVITIISILYFSIGNTYAQNKEAYKIKEDTIVNFKDRWSFKTNALGWLMTVPNAAVEFDLSNSVYNRLTIGLEGKYNGYTSHTYLPYIVFNYWEVRPEIRKYWRTEYRNNSGIEPTLREKLFSKQRTKPRYWRAYYLGGYMNYGGYDLKFSENGIRGNFFSAGISAGYSIPLYSYEKGNIDIEFGGSLGVMAANKNGFKLDRENNSYIPTANVKNWHIVPYPVVNDLRVSFIFRFKSIKDKYKRIDYEKIQRKEALKIERRRIKDSIRVAEQIADSLHDVRKKFVKDSIKASRLLNDSLLEVNNKMEKDSIEKTKLLRRKSKRKKSDQSDEKNKEKSEDVSREVNSEAIIKEE